MKHLGKQNDLYCELHRLSAGQRPVRHLNHGTPRENANLCCIARGHGFPLLEMRQWWAGQPVARDKENI